MNEFPVALPGAQADTLMWADPEMIEPAALAQLRHISRLPWVHQLRGLPAETLILTPKAGGGLRTSLDGSVKQQSIMDALAAGSARI